MINILIQALLRNRKGIVMEKFKELAKFIVDNVGGKENVIRLSHCMTRLRFVLKDETKANTDALKNKDGIASVVKGGGEYQVVIGNKVEDVYDQVMPLLGIKEDEEGPKKKQSLLNAFMDTISQIFNPILGLLCGTGIISGLSMILVATHLITKDSGTYQILSVIGNCFLYYSPILLGFTAAKKFKLNPFTGAAIGACLLHPTILGILNQDPLYTMFAGTLIESPVYTTFLKVPVLLMDYASSVIPVIFACYFAAKVEKVLKKVIPAFLRLFLVPALTLLIIVPLTFIIIGPVSIWLSQVISVGLTSLHDFMPVLSGAVIGGLWQILVVFGLHRGFTPITLQNLQMYGFDSVFAVRLVITFAIFGTVLSVFLKTKNLKIKETALPAAISSFFGISEPGIYGITMPYKKLFFTSCISAAAGGAVIGFFGTKIYSVAGLGILALPGYISPEGINSEFLGAVAGVLVTVITSFILARIVWKEPQEEVKEKKVDFESMQIMAPLEGKVIELQKVEDELFSTCALGNGIAIEPANGKVVSPVDGVVTSLFPTGHAIGITTKENVEILIHIGMNTVNLNGKYFTTKVKQGDLVTLGQELIDFDVNSIKKEGYIVTTPIVITNTKNFSDVVAEQIDDVRLGDKIITIIK